jgi:hypothetical protein
VIAAIAAPAQADIRILSSGGGTVSGYLQFFLNLKQSGERVAIDGPCYSACTLVLSVIPQSRICVTRRAVLGFHAPRLVAQNGRQFRSASATRVVTASYPPKVRNWIARHGGLKQKLILLRGRELMVMYPRC